MSAEAELIVAGVAALTAAGGAVRFIWTKLEQRFLHIEKQLEECRKREDRQGQRRAVYMLAVELLLGEVERLAGRKSRIMVRVQKLLDTLDDDDHGVQHEGAGM